MRCLFPARTPLGAILLALVLAASAQAATVRPASLSLLPAGSWGDGFESGDFHRWSWWGQGQASLWGHVDVVSARSAHLPSSERKRVARFETTRADVAAGRLHAKLFKSFFVGVGAARRPPIDVSGTYRAFYYLSKRYSVPRASWVNMFQFKERYRSSGGEVSDPLWWVQMGGSRNFRSLGAPRRSRPDAPVAFVNHWRNDWRRRPRFRSVPLGRWFEVRAEVHQGDRIDFYLDGRRLDTAGASEYPVSPFHGGSGQEWIFGIGNYSTAANGPMYADAASFAPR